MWLSFVSPDDGGPAAGEGEPDADGGVTPGGHRWRAFSDDNEQALNELREPLLDDL